MTSEILKVKKRFGYPHDFGRNTTSHFFQSKKQQTFGIWVKVI